MLKHKKIEDLILQKYPFKKQIIKKFTYFYKVSDSNFNSPLFFIEKIPAWKYFTTIYIQNINVDFHNSKEWLEVQEFIGNEYRKQHNWPVKYQFESTYFSFLF